LLSTVCFANQSVDLMDNRGLDVKSADPFKTPKCTNFTGRYIRDIYKFMRDF